MASQIKHNFKNLHTISLRPDSSWCSCHHPPCIWLFSHWLFLSLLCSHHLLCLKSPSLPFSFWKLFFQMSLFLGSLHDFFRWELSSLLHVPTAHGTDFCIRTQHTLTFVCFFSAWIWVLQEQRLGFVHLCFHPCLSSCQLYFWCWRSKDLFLQIGKLRSSDKMGISFIEHPSYRIFDVLGSHSHLICPSPWGSISTTLSKRSGEVNAVKHGLLKVTEWADGKLCSRSLESWISYADTTLASLSPLLPGFLIFCLDSIFLLDFQSTT